MVVHKCHDSGWGNLISFRYGSLRDFTRDFLTNVKLRQGIQLSEDRSPSDDGDLRGVK